MNIQITEYVKDYYEGSNGVLGCRQMCININREKIDELPHKVNVKRVRRIMRILGLKSVIRKKRPDYVKSTPEITPMILPLREHCGKLCQCFALSQR